MMIEKAALMDIGTLAGFQSDCSKCGHQTRFVRSIAPAFAMGGGDEIYGGRCGSCHTILWAQDSFNSILLHLCGDPPAGMSRKEHKKAVADRFLASLPPCPVCSAQSYTAFIGSEADEKPVCGKCGAESSPFRGYVRAMLGDAVYILHESEDAAEKSRKMRNSFVHWDRLI